ncbi:hypothetical protein [Methylobacterium nodulans]|uniref:Glycoside hydrolase family 19 catalytic domain-containing protein n=1 Tax=Methylobacterium nodulans (strain LMG 21967 / CNCM I-2342 / ORS 2060) TaxID=460265 RepID=B8ITL4_METNO|nr:hypothetical protein [Methylobacterium nodulans]ACL58930.1 conserved hypothetical protein [Methylobacterium nodulans ORS 2060]
MAASLDRQAFFSAVRTQPFGGSLTQSQVDGMDAMLDMAPPDMGAAPLAYCLATAFDETGGAMIPRAENLNYTTAERIRAVWPSRFPTVASAVPYVRNPQGLANKVYGGRLGNTGPNDGWLFRGMGLVQATGKDNAIRATKRLRALGYLTPDQDLVATPELMLNPDIAAVMLFVGLSEGWYTGRKLSDYFGPGRENPTHARAMVNPDSNGPAIATIHGQFKAALVAAGHKPGAVTIAIPTPPITMRPLPAPDVVTPAVEAQTPVIGASTPAPSASWASRLPSALRRLFRVA